VTRGRLTLGRNRGFQSKLPSSSRLPHPVTLSPSPADFTPSIRRPLAFLLLPPPLTNCVHTRGNPRYAFVTPTCYSRKLGPIVIALTRGLQNNPALIKSSRKWEGGCRTSLTRRISVALRRRVAALRAISFVRDGSLIGRRWLVINKYSGISLKRCGLIHDVSAETANGEGK